MPAKPNDRPAGPQHPRLVIREGETAKVESAGVEITVVHVGHHSQGSEPAKHAVELVIASTPAS